MTMHRRWGVTTAMILAVFLGACGKSGEDAAPATKPKVEVYEMRGEVRKWVRTSLSSLSEDGAFEAPWRFWF